MACQAIWIACTIKVFMMVANSLLHGTAERRNRAYKVGTANGVSLQKALFFRCQLAFFQ